ncbi:MAG: hypothetical protein WC476_02400 [Phycisphaerae bacterium]|jgi:hypothetical protein
MGFEEFTAKTRTNIRIPMVSILRYGRIALNRECYGRYFKDYKFVLFLYDKSNNKIGVKPTNQAQSNAFNIKVDKKGNLANISAISFLKYYKIPFDKSQSFTCHWNATDNFLEVQL